MFTANHDAICLSLFQPPPPAPVDGVLIAPRNPPQVVHAALPPMLVANRPPIRRDASYFALQDASPQPKIADSEPLRFTPLPPPQFSDSQPSRVVTIPQHQLSFQSVFNGQRLASKARPARSIRFQLPDLNVIINSQLIIKSPASYSNPQPPSNRRQN